MSPDAARDALHQSEAFFQGWTPEHTRFLIVFLVILLVWWLKPGNGA